MKAVLYLRYSDPKQNDNTTIASQEKLCRAYCQANEWEIIDVAKNEAVSADEEKTKYTHRVADLLEYCKSFAGKLQVLVVWKLDRFARSNFEHHYMKNKLKNMGIILRSATEIIDETPSGELMEGVIASFNQYDNSVRRVRAKIGAWQRVEEGLWPFNIPTGYKKVRLADEKLMPFVVDDTCSWAIVEIFNKYATGTVTKVQLAREYQAKEIKNHKGKIIKFSPQSIDNILKKIYYAKYLPHPTKGPLPGKHDGLITLELFNKCQAAVKENSNKNTGTRQRDNPTFPLRKFVKCLECNEPMTGAMQRHRFPLYWCHNKNCSLKYKTTRKLNLENSFYDYLQKVKPTEQFVARFNELFMARLGKIETDIQGLYKVKFNKVQELQAHKDWCMEKAKKGVMDDDVLKEELAKNKSDLELAKLELTEAHKEELDIAGMLAEAEQFIRTLENTWYDAPPEVKVRLQRFIFPSGVQMTKDGFRTVKLCGLFELINSSADLNSKMVTL